MDRLRRSEEQAGEGVRGADGEAVTQTRLIGRIDSARTAHKSRGPSDTESSLGGGPTALNLLAQPDALGPPPRSYTFTFPRTHSQSQLIRISVVTRQNKSSTFSTRSSNRKPLAIININKRKFFYN